MSGPISGQALTCNCGKTALYRVGSTGYCKTHRQDAVRRRQSISRTIESERAEFDTLITNIERTRRAVDKMHAALRRKRRR